MLLHKMKLEGKSKPDGIPWHIMEDVHETKKDVLDACSFLLEVRVTNFKVCNGFVLEL